jgi:hypothetical protein
MRRRPTAKTSTKIGIRRLRLFSKNVAVTNFPARARLRLALNAARKPEVASAKTTTPKKGKAQIISLSRLPNGGISMSERKTSTSVPSATIAAIKEKYVK